MSEEKVIFTDEQITRYSAALDGAFDFNKLSIKFKFLGLFNINVAKILEKVDGKAWTKIFELINSMCKDGKIDEELINLFSAILANVDSSDETNFAKVIVEFILDKATSLGDTTKETITTVTTTVVDKFGDFLDKFNEELDALELEAEEQDA